MDLSTKVNITLCVLSFVLAFISVVTVVLTLIQNNKMIENSTRPYICIYFDCTQWGEPIGYFVIKNFGSSAAFIDSLTYNDIVKECPKTLADISTILDRLSGSIIAPGQKFLVPFRVSEYKSGVSVFDIRYHIGRKKYSEHFEIVVDNYGKIVKPRLKGNEVHTISYPLQEISERLM